MCWEGTFIDSWKSISQLLLVLSQHIPAHCRERAFVWTSCIPFFFSEQARFLSSNFTMYRSWPATMSTPPFTSQVPSASPAAKKKSNLPLVTPSESHAPPKEIWMSNTRCNVVCRVLSHEAERMIRESSGTLRLPEHRQGRKRKRKRPKENMFPEQRRLFR